MVNVYQSLAKVWVSDSENLNDSGKIDALVKGVSNALGTNILKTASHKFKPSGYTSFALLSESHIAVHTWPEEGFMAIDVMSCKGFDGKKLETLIRSSFHVTKYICESNNFSHTHKDTRR